MKQHCITCKYGEITMPPTVGGFQDGVNCSNRKMMEYLEEQTDNDEIYRPEFEAEGFMNLFRIESLEGDDASCECWENK